MHRDIKLENMLLAGDFRTSKLCDFGIAIQKSAETWELANLMEGAGGEGGREVAFSPLFVWLMQIFKKGTVWYAAPEIYQCYETSDPYIGWPCDIWSFGACIYCACTGDSDADLGSMATLGTLSSFLQGKRQFENARSLEHLLLCCLQIDERKRPHAQKLREMLKDAV